MATGKFTESQAAWRCHTGMLTFFFQCKELGTSHAKSREQGESKGRCCLIWCVGNPGHSSLQDADAKILPEFRETREIHGLKDHHVLLSAMAVLLRDAGAAGSRVERMCGDCALPGHLSQPRTSPLGGWLLLSIATRHSSEASNLDTGLPSADPPCPAPSPRALWLLLLSNQETQACSPAATALPGHPASHPPPSPFPAGGHQHKQGQWSMANSSQPSPARALRRWRELSPACEPAAPARPREHGRLYFHCKLEINHSRKFPC